MSDPSPKEFMSLSDPQRRAAMDQVKAENKQSKQKILGVLSGDTRSSVAFMFSQGERMDAHTYDSPEDRAGKAAASQYLNELMNLYNNPDNPFMNKLADSGGLSQFFDQMLGLSPYFQTQNGMNGTTYPTDFKSFMKWRNEQMGFEE